MVSILAANYNQENSVNVDDKQKVDGAAYLFKDPNESDTSFYLDGILSFLKFFLLLSSILPISLLVSLEIIKVIQSLFIMADAKMYSVDVDQRCKVMSISLNEELGLINNIFTDKTGTLTANEMIFKACSVGKIKYDKKTAENINFELDSNSEEEKHSDHKYSQKQFSDNDNEDNNVLKVMKKILTLNITCESY